MAKEEVHLTVSGPHGDRELRVSSPARVVWPGLGITKLDLARYMVAVGDAFLAANGDRPVSLQRFPRTRWTASSSSPRTRPRVRRISSVRSTSSIPAGGWHPQLVIDEIAAAVWAVQMNTVVFHPWASPGRNTDNPDELRIDLDPQPGTGFAEAVPVALELRERARGGRAGGVHQDLRQPGAPRLLPRSSRPTSSWTCGMPSSRRRANSSGACPTR